MGQQIEFALRQSMHRVLVVLVSFLPGVLVFLLAVILLTGLGLLLATIARRILIAARFDERLASRETTGSPASFSDWAPSHSPTLLVSRVILWACTLLGIAIGIEAVDASYSANSQLSQFLLPYLTHVLGAILLLFAGTIVARFLSLGVKWLVLVLTAAMALDHLQIGGVIIELAFGILFGGIVLTLSLAVGLGSRDLVSRSIEKTIDKPAGRNDPEPFPAPGETSRPKLRHF